MRPLIELYRTSLRESQPPSTGVYGHGSYTVRLSAPGVDPEEVHVSGPLAPSEDDLDEEPGAIWDVMGLAIVAAGEPFTTMTGVHDFHDIPVGSTRDSEDTWTVGPVTLQVL